MTNDTTHQTELPARVDDDNAPTKVEFVLACLLSAVIGHGIVSISTGSDPVVAQAWEQFSTAERVQNWVLALMLASPAGIALALALVRIHRRIAARGRRGS